MTVAKSVTIGTLTRTVREWAAISGVAHGTITYRLRNCAMSYHDAVFLVPKARVKPPARRTKPKP